MTVKYLFETKLKAQWAIRTHNIEKLMNLLHFLKVDSTNKKLGKLEMLLARHILKIKYLRTYLINKLSCNLR